MNLRFESNIPKFLILVFVFLTSCSHDNHRHNTRIYIPEGYEGWIRVEYGVKDAEPLPREWRFPPPILWNREVIPASGLLRTSTELEGNSTVGGEFYFYNGGSVRPADKKIALCELTSLHNFQFLDANEKQQFTTYFIGTASEEYRCQELERFKTGSRFPVYAAQNIRDLPTVGNLKGSISPNAAIEHALGGDSP